MSYSKAKVLALKGTLSGIRLRVFVTIGFIALDVICITLIQMIRFITSQKKMKCKSLPCTKQRRFQFDDPNNEDLNGGYAKDIDFDVIFTDKGPVKAHNVCLKYIFITDFSIWVALLGLSLEFTSTVNLLYDQIQQIDVQHLTMTPDMFQQYITMLETSNNASNMFFELTLIYG